jgi:hypothetical protein
MQLFKAVPMTPSASQRLTLAARDNAVFSGRHVLAKRFAVLQKEQTSVVTTVNDTGDKIVPGVVDTCQK